MPNRLYYGQPINWGHPLNRGLVARWQVVPWYASGPRFISLTGRYHGTLTNGPTWQGARGRGWGSLSFDGSNDHAPTGFVHTPVGGHSMFAWVNLAADTGIYTIAGLRTATQNGWAYRIRGDVGDQIQYAHGGIAEVNATATVTLGEWTHIGVTWDESTATHYLNGRANGSSALSGYNAAAVEMYLGALNNNGSATHFWNGRLDDIRDYNRALSASEVAELYQLSRRPDDPTLNWLRPVRVFDVGAAPPAGNRRRRLICGAAA